MAILKMQTTIMLVVDDEKVTWRRPRTGMLYGIASEHVMTAGPGTPTSAIMAILDHSGSVTEIERRKVRRSGICIAGFNVAMNEQTYRCISSV